MKTVYSQPLFVLSSLAWITSLCVADETPPSCGFPGIKARKDSGVFLWNDCFSDQWHIRAVAGGQAVTYTGTLVSETDGISKVTDHSTEGNDSVNIPDFTLDITKRDQDGFDFKLEGDACLSINAPPGTMLYAGKNRVALPTSSIGIPGFKPCNGPQLEYLFESREKDTGAKEWNGKFERGARYSSYGMSKNSLQLDGRDDHFLINESSSLKMPKYTMMAWVRSRESNEPFQMVIEKAAALWLNIRENGLVRTGGFFGGCGDKNFFRMDSTKPIPREAWTHVAVTNNRKKMKIYINGELSGEERLPTKRPYCSNQGPFNVGSMYRGSQADSGGYFNGFMDTVRVYDMDLGQDEIRSEMFRN